MTISSNDYYLTIYLIPDTYINYCLLLGSDLLKYVHIKLTENNNNKERCY